MSPDVGVSPAVNEAHMFQAPRFASAVRTGINHRDEARLVRDANRRPRQATVRESAIVSHMDRIGVKLSHATVDEPA